MRKILYHISIFKIRAAINNDCGRCVTTALSLFIERNSENIKRNTIINQIERGEGDTKQQAWQIPTEKKRYLPAREKPLRLLARRKEYLNRLKELGVVKRDGDIRLTHVRRPEREERPKREKRGKTSASMEVRSVIQL